MMVIGLTLKNTLETSSTSRGPKSQLGKLLQQLLVIQEGLACVVVSIFECTLLLNQSLGPSLLDLNTLDCPSLDLVVVVAIAIPSRTALHCQLRPSTMDSFTILPHTLWVLLPPRSHVETHIFARKWITLSASTTSSLDSSRITRLFVLVLESFLLTHSCQLSF